MVLKKPANCDCGSISSHREYHPERWICNDCQTIICSRKQKSNPNICRNCKVQRDSRPFKKGKNLCMDCHNKYMQNWKTENAEHLKDYRRTPKYKKNRREIDRKSVQRSPKSFVRHLARRLTKLKHQSKRKINPIRLDIKIGFNDLWVLYEQQYGLCAISNLPMTHKYDDLCSISIDRIDSKYGYILRNIQLVCKWANLAKQHHSNEEFKQLLNQLRQNC